MLFRLSLTALLAVWLLSPRAEAQQAGSHHQHSAESETPTGPHGGSLHRAGDAQFESVVEPAGLRLFAYDHEGQPLDLRYARGLATLHVAGAAKRYRYDLFPEMRPDGSAESVAVAVDLRRFADQRVDLKFQLIGLPGAERRPIAFAASTVAPRTDEQRVAAAITAQGVCPVSGQPLGSMGDPIPVDVGDQTVYVCCAGCTDAVQEDPAKYSKPKLTIAPATEADAESIARQAICPVMDEPLESMGTPLKVTGLARDVFLCCKGCIKFLERDPAKYLTKLRDESRPPIIP